MNTIIYTIKYQYIVLLKQSRRGIYLKACLESYMALVFNFIAVACTFYYHKFM